MLARIFLAALLLFGQFAPSLAGSPALRQQMMQPPGWVNHNYYPTSDFNEALQRYWTQSGYTGPTQQLTVSRASIGTYSDSSGNWYTAANNVARIGYGTGVWVEEARTNSIRNNTMQGGGGGGTPTNWAINQGAGLTVAFGSVSTIQGASCINISILGTAAGTTQRGVYSEAPQQISVSYGQTWAHSVLLQYVSGVAPSGGVLVQVLSENSSGTTLTNYSSGANVLTSALTRYGEVATITDSAAAYARPLIVISVATSEVVNYSFNECWPQLELNPLVNSSVASATVNAGGTLYTPSSSGTVTWSGSGCTTNPVLNVTTSGAGVINAVTSVATAGSCTTFPSSSATTWTDGTGLGTGSGASFNLVPTNNSAQGLATSPIPTTNAAVARAADLITYASPGTFCPGGYSMVAWGTPFAPTGSGSSQNLIQLDSGSSAERTLIRRASGTGGSLLGQVGGTGTNMTFSGPYATGSQFKAGLSAIIGTAVGAVNNSIITESWSALPTLPTFVRVGSGSSNEFFNGTIARTTLFNCTVLPAAALQSVTNPNLWN